MRETTYTCDRCKEKIDSEFDMTKIVLTLGSHIRNGELHLECCEDCIVALGLDGATYNIEEPTPPARGVFDILEELIGLLQDRGLLACPE